MQLSEFIAGLPTLSQGELVTVRAACDRLIKSSVDAVDETNPLFDALAQLLGVKLSFRDFHNITAYTSWKRHAPGVVDFITQLYPDVSKAMKTGVMKFLLEALRDDLKDRGVPITIGTMTINLDRLPEIYDCCFPDYRETGNQQLVLEAMTRRK